MLNQLTIVLSHENQGVAFLLHQRINLAVVVAFVSAPENQHCRSSHTLQCVPTRVDVGGFGVVDITNTAHCSHILQTMIHTRKLLQTLANHIVVDIQNLRCQTCCHGVELIVFALQREFIQWYVQWRHIGFSSNHQMTTIGVCHVLLVAAKWIKGCLWLNACYLAVEYWILAPIDERIFAGLVARDAELSIDIVLELMVVAIQVIGRDIQQNSNICFEIVAVIQLER